MKKFFTIAFVFSLICSATFAQTKSPKRGIGYGYHSVADMEAISQGISWWYNWAPQADAGLQGRYPTGEVAFVPMVWGGSFNVDDIVSSIPDGAQYLLGFNEPNFRDQSNLTAQQAAALWPKLEEIARRKNLEIVGPAMNYCANCVVEGQSDPVEYLDEFFAACQDCQVDYISIHWYACSGGALQWYIDRFKKYGKPIWVTEIACWEGNPTVEQQKAYMTEAVEIMENDPVVMKYAWFTGRSSGPNIDLFSPQSGQLSELGELYVSLPFNGGGNNNDFQPIPARIQAESYSNMSGVQNQATSDVGGGQNVGWIDKGDWMEYQINVPAAGTYKLTYRVASTAGTGQFQMQNNGSILATVNVPNTGGWQNWTTISTTISLPAGQQTLRMDVTAAPFNINWLEFSAITAEVSNLAKQKPASASSTQSGLPVTNINDENKATRWGSAWADPQWVQIDLQATYNISRIVLNWEAASGKAYEIHVSDNGSDWSTIYSEGNGDGGLDQINLSGTGRYIRMYGTQRNTGYGYSLFEFEVYGSASVSASAGESKSELVSFEKKIADQKISVYPVPVKDVLNIVLQGGSYSALELLDIQGKSLLKRDIKNLQEISIIMENYSSGLYIIKLRGKQGFRTSKILKQ